MPAELPPESAYTYCVELSADEAVAAGATSVEFSKPVVVHLENFLGFRTGSSVPAGYYDRERAEWIASENGRVIRVASIDAGLANLEGAADLSITDEERRILATLYAPGTSLWRIPIRHFTPWDMNWPWWLPDGAEYPSLPEAFIGDALVGQPCQSGSIIECETLVLGKSIPIAGTPFTLEHRSRNADGFAGRRQLAITLGRATLPPPLKRIDVTLEVAGRTFRDSFTPAPNRTLAFAWDGRDAYGRRIYGDRALRVRIDYVYDRAYRDPAAIARAFGAVSFGAITDVRARREAALSQSYSVLLAGPSPTQALGGWTISGVHAFDAQNEVLRLGSGVDVRLASNGRQPVSGGVTGFDAMLVAAAADGSVYACGPNGRILRIAPEGSITVVAGGGTTPPGNGAPATATSLTVNDLAVAANGDIVFVHQSSQIFRVRNGVLRAVAPGIDITSVAPAPDGTVSFTDNGNLRRVDGDGNVSQVAPATASVRYHQVRVGGTGVPILDVMEVCDDNGNFCHGFYRGSHAPGRKLLSLDRCIPSYTVDGAGMVYFAVTSCAHGSFDTDIRVLQSDGTHRGLPMIPPAASPSSMAVLPNGDVAYVDMQAHDICATQRCVVLNGVAIGHTASDGIIVPSPSGGEAYRFSAAGKHLETRDLLTGDLRYRIRYDALGNGPPTAIEDANGRITQIIRSGSTATLIAPTGDRTTIELDPVGNVAAISGPQGHHEFSFDSAGLLRTYGNPRGQLTTYDYDSEGRLGRVSDAAGGAKQLMRSTADQLETVLLTTLLGRVWRYTLKRFDVANADRTIRHPAGIQGTMSLGASLQTQQMSDGTRFAVERLPDPQWQSAVPRTSNVTMTLPSGRVLRLRHARTVSPSTVTNPLALAASTDFLNINGRIYSTTYTAGDRRFRSQTPLGRRTGARAGNGRVR